MNRTELIFRIVGMIVLAILGVYWGIELGEIFGVSQILASAVLGVIGAVVGFIVTPYVTTRPASYLVQALGKTSFQSLIAGLVGLVVGLLVAALAAFPLSMLPNPFGQILPFIGVLLFSYLGIVIFVMRQKEIFGGFSSRWQLGASAKGEEAEKPEDVLLNEGAGRSILVDTSVIIDGRIADIANTGFLSGTLLIPHFVLNSDIDVEGVREVDEKLVVLARQLLCPILTNDYNLNRVAELQGVSVLNVNDLANAVKSVLLPGEIIDVNIIQEGRESGQGVAYLDDGTMVVVEDGRSQINQQTNVTVTKVLQTTAGRMVFARLDNNKSQ
jgi:uncharacterized protein YacL